VVGGIYDMFTNVTFDTRTGKHKCELFELEIIYVQAIWWNRLTVD
jgi:hypothetical protein